MLQCNHIMNICGLLGKCKRSRQIKINSLFNHLLPSTSGSSMNYSKQNLQLIILSTFWHQFWKCVRYKQNIIQTVLRNNTKWLKMTCKCSVTVVLITYLSLEWNSFSWYLCHKWIIVTTQMTKEKTGAFGEMRIDRETKVIRVNLPQYHSVHHKSHMNWPGVNFVVTVRS